MKFLIFSEYGEILDVALHLQDVEKHEVEMYIHRKAEKRIGDGMVKKIEHWWQCMHKNYIWVFDSCNFGNLQDWLRKEGEVVFGGSELADRLENNRQLNQKWFKELGFKQVFSKNFKDIDKCIQFIETHNNKRYVLKQNGSAPKSLNHAGVFTDCSDMLFHLKELKKGWNKLEYGDFDCDLMEFVEGLEVAASAFFNGHDFLRNKEGKVVGYVNFEEKKEMNGGMGETTGEMGTTFLGVTEENKIFKQIIMVPGIKEKLTEIGFRGVFDINTIFTENGVVALEPTMRCGIPSTSYEFLEGLISSTGDLLEAVAKGKDIALQIHESIGMVMVVAAKPFPIESENSDVDTRATSVGEKLWILKNDKPNSDFTAEQQNHIHPYNFEKMKDGDTHEVFYQVVTKSGYLLTVTGRGNTIQETRNNLIQYIQDNIYISGMKYRTDIGQRVENILINFLS